MYIKKIIIIILLLLIIKYFISRKDNFQNIDINLLVDKSEYNTINLGNAKVKLNPNNDSNYNVDIQNDIIAEDKIRINGKDINIELLRYIKKLPIHYEKEICLGDSDGIECINNDHIDMLKGNLPLKLITYPDNYRKCLSAFDTNIIPMWISSEPTNYKIFSAGNCSNGNSNQEFFMERNPETHNNDSHYHHHDIKKLSHEHHPEPDTPTMRTIDNLDFSILENSYLNKEDALFMGISEAEFDQYDTDNDGKISPSQVLKH